MLIQLLVYITSFIGLWFGAGIAIKSVEKFSRNIKISSFAISFLILGFSTSISEMSVGLNAIMTNDPEIYVGDLIGASIVIFLLIIPILAITGKQININPELRGINLILPLIVASLPVILSLDGKVDYIDSIISLMLYMYLILTIQTKQSLFKKATNILKSKDVKIKQEMATIIIGACIIFISSHFVVKQTIYFSDLLHLSPFFISLLVIAIGTNLPELSLAVRSFVMRNKQIAFGDYMGSAAFNTFLFGALTLLYRQPVYLTNSYVISLVFLIVGLILFYIFARSKDTISRLEGFGLLTLYIAFLAVESFIHIYI